MTTTTPPIRLYTPDQRAAALSKLIHDEYLNLGDHLPECLECAALSGLLTGLVRMARSGNMPELIEALVAECAETLELVEREPVTVQLDESTDLSAMYSAYLTVEARQARRKRIGWTCKACGMRGSDGPGLASFWAHHDAWHTAERYLQLEPDRPRASIFAGTNR